MIECTLQISTGHRDSTLYLVDGMLTLTDRRRNAPRQIFLNERRGRRSPISSPPSPSFVPPGSAVACSCEELRVPIRPQPWLNFKMTQVGPGSLRICMYQRELKPRGNILVKILRNQLFSSSGIDPANKLCSMQFQSNNKIFFSLGKVILRQKVSLCLHLCVSTHH